MPIAFFPEKTVKTDTIEQLTVHTNGRNDFVTIDDLTYNLMKPSDILAFIQSKGILRVNLVLNPSPPPNTESATKATARASAFNASFSLDGNYSKAMTAGQTAADATLDVVVI